MRRQIIYSLLQEDESDSLHLIASFLLFDGRQNENTFIVMSEEGLFPRLLELIQAQKKDDPESAGTGLHQILMDLLYEMARIQRLRIEDLGEFIKKKSNNIPANGCFLPPGNFLKSSVQRKRLFLQKKKVPIPLERHKREKKKEGGEF